MAFWNLLISRTVTANWMGLSSDPVRLDGFKAGSLQWCVAPMWCPLTPWTKASTLVFHHPCCPRGRLLNSWLQWVQNCTSMSWPRVQSAVWPHLYQSPGAWHLSFPSNQGLSFTEGSPNDLWLLQWVPHYLKLRAYLSNVAVNLNDIQEQEIFIRSLKQGYNIS